MSPQQSFFLSDGLHAIVTHCEQFCMECINMPFKCAYNSDFKCITSNENICCFATGESSYPPTRLGSIGRTHYGGVPATLVPKHSQFRPPDKRIQFNRMNGSPGDPPGSSSLHNQSLTQPPGEGVTMSKWQSLSRFSLHRLMSAYGTGLSTDAGTCKQITSTKLKE